MTEDQIREFQVRLQEAIKYRQEILDPKQKMFKLPLSYQDEEKVRIQMDVLRDVLEDFEGVFGVEGLNRVTEML
jgi:hypothetical protein